MFLTRVFLG